MWKATWIISHFLKSQCTESVARSKMEDWVQQVWNATWISLHAEQQSQRSLADHSTWLSGATSGGKVHDAIPKSQKALH